MNSVRFIALLCFITAFVFVGIGMYKMYIYDNPTSELSIFDEEDYANVYVEGDAYNYIINAGKATANYTLGIFFTVIGFGMLILEALNFRKKDVVVSSHPNTETINSELN